MGIHQGMVHMATLTQRPEELKLTATGQKPMVAPTWPRLFLRIHAKTSDLDLSFVRKALRIVDEESVIENAFNDEYEDIATFDFSNEPQLSSEDEVRRWPNRAFSNAEEWLLKRTPEQLVTIRNA